MKWLTNLFKRRGKKIKPGQGNKPLPYQSRPLSKKSTDSVVHFVRRGKFLNQPVAYSPRPRSFSSAGIPLAPEPESPEE